jgi:phosphotransferase system  glucose/maltose/N-acetylglucosamine-specific IIC component
MALARGGHGRLLAWGYTGLGNLDVDVVGATNSLTRDVMLMLMLMLIVVVVIAIFVVVLLSAWIGGRVWKTGIIVP